MINSKKIRIEAMQILYQAWMERNSLQKMKALLREKRSWITKKSEIKCLSKLVQGVFYSYILLKKYFLGPIHNNIEKEDLLIRVIFYLSAYELLINPQDKSNIIRDYHTISDQYCTPGVKTAVVAIINKLHLKE